VASETIRTFFKRILRFFFTIQKTWLFTFFWVDAHVFSNTGCVDWASCVIIR